MRNSTSLRWAGSHTLNSFLLLSAWMRTPVNFYDTTGQMPGLKTFA
jgi:hypothetical protein